VLFEPIGLAVHDWAHPQPGRPRMFDQNLLEWFSHPHPISLVIIYLPTSAYFVWKSLNTGIPFTTTIALVATGVFVWTLLEYVIHRFSFHYTPRGRIGMFYAYVIHGVHHAFPEDDSRWLVPPIVSVPISLLLYFAYRWIAKGLFPPLFAGGLMGYLMYDLSHYAMHRGPSRFRLFNVLRKHHMQHHYATPERWYGVSTPLWDYVFRTAARAARRQNA
jgi:sterol desaturase/sphingolipid hydroxylase (fatty acid hydroxylase superfamily)